MLKVIFVDKYQVFEMHLGILKFYFPKWLFGMGGLGWNRAEQLLSGGNFMGNQGGGLRLDLRDRAIFKGIRDR